MGHGLHHRPASAAPASASRGAWSWAWGPRCRTRVWGTGNSLGLPVGWGALRLPQDPWRQHSRSPVLVVCGPVFFKLTAFSPRHFCFKIALLFLLRTESPLQLQQKERDQRGRSHQPGDCREATGSLPLDSGVSKAGGWEPHSSRGFPLKGKDRGRRQPTQVEGTSRSLGSQALSVARRPPSP